MKIYAENKQYSGVTASIPFTNGVGVTDDPYLIDWFGKHGYTVEEVEDIEKMIDNEPKKRGRRRAVDDGENNDQ